jgi:hypothetical protein
MLHDPAHTADRRYSRFLPLGADLFNRLAVIHDQNLVLAQVPLPAFGLIEPAQSTSEDKPVKAGDHSLNTSSHLGDKLIHGVLLGCCIVALKTPFNTSFTGNASSFGCAYAALCHDRRMLSTAKAAVS